MLPIRIQDSCLSAHGTSFSHALHSFRIGSRASDHDISRPLRRPARTRRFDWHKHARTAHSVSIATSRATLAQLGRQEQKYSETEVKRDENVQKMLVFRSGGCDRAVELGWAGRGSQV
jgi:hypothetical protein